MPVIIYSTPSCPFCNKAKNFFRQNNIPFIDHNVAVDERKREEMIRKSHQMGVPVIDINGHIIVGFDERRIRQLLHL